MKRGSIVSDLFKVGWAVAISTIDAECKSKRKSKEKDEAMIALRDTLLARYPLPKGKK